MTHRTALSSLALLLFAMLCLPSHGSAQAYQVDETYELKLDTSILYLAMMPDKNLCILQINTQFLPLLHLVMKNNQFKLKKLLQCHQKAI